VVAGAWQPAAQVVMEEFELLEQQQLVVALMWWVEIG